MYSVSNPPERWNHKSFIVTVNVYIIGIMHPLLPTGSEEREVLGVGSIPVAIVPSCQFMKTIAL